jgi:hypothetical protein
MEKSDGGLQNRLTSELSGLTGGARSKGNGNGNGKHKQEQQKEKPLEHSVFKYSSRFRGPLHESIMLGSGPFFLTYSGANGHLGLVRQIEENNRILVPPSIEEHPYEPIEFSSKREIKDYEEMALNETIDSLYQKLKSVVKLYIDQDAEIVILITADIIWTHFQDLYPTIHYYDVTGKENGIGKSTIGYLFEAIGYRGVRMTDPSAANLYRILGKIEPGQCTIIADEADRIHQDKDMLSILKEGSEGSYGQEEDKSDRGISQEQEQDDNISNDNDIKQQISEEMKEGKLPMPGIGPSQPSQPSHTFPNIHRLGNTDQFGCTDCNLRGDKWFMQEHKCRRGKSKNKVADAAAPTSSGDG